MHLRPWPHNFLQPSLALALLQLTTVRTQGRDLWLLGVLFVGGGRTVRCLAPINAGAQRRTDLAAKDLDFLGRIVTVAAGVLHPGHVDIATTGCLLLLPWQRDSDVPVVKRSRLPATPPLSELQRMKSPPLGWTPSPFRSSERCRNHREGEDMQDQDGDQASTGIDRLHLCSRVCVI